MTTKLIDFLNRPFIRNVLILLSGTIMAQVVNLIFSPIITRIYGPEAYGLLGTFGAVVSTLAPISALTYPIAMVLPKSDKKSDLVGKLSFLITIINVIIVFIFLLFFGDFIISLFNLEKVSEYVYLIPFIVLSAGILQIMEQWLIRRKEFQTSAKSSFIEALIVNVGKLGIGFFNPIASVLIFFTVFRQGLKALIMMFFSGFDNIKKLFTIKKEDLKSMKELAKIHYDFPVYRAPQEFINSVTESLPILLLTIFFGPASAGFYSISRSVMSIPASVIGRSFGNVFYPRASEVANENKKITPLLVKATFYLILIAIIPFGLVVIVGPWLFSLVFGQEWVVAGQYARWVAIWLFFAFINRPSVQLLPILNAQRFQLIYTISNLIFKTIALFIGFYFYQSDIVAIALFSIVGGLTNIIMITIVFYKTYKFDQFSATS